MEPILVERVMFQYEVDLDSGEIGLINYVIVSVIDWIGNGHIDG